jgi:hypothetical protein
VVDFPGADRGCRERAGSFFDEGAWLAWFLQGDTRWGRSRPVRVVKLDASAL